LTLIAPRTIIHIAAWISYLRRAPRGWQHGREARHSLIAKSFNKFAGGPRVIGQNKVPVQADWEHPPLCSRITVAYLGRLAVQGVLDDSAVERVLHWALGLLADGECEPLGAWVQPVEGRMPWQEVFAGLKVRGVRQIRMVASGAPTEVRDGLRAVYPAAHAVPSIEHRLSQSLALVAPRHREAVAGVLGGLAAAADAGAAMAALDDIQAGRWGATYPALVEQWRPVLGQLGPFYALPVALRHVFLAGDRRVQALRRSIDRAVERHGPFADAGAAASFLTHLLQHRERRQVSRAQAGVFAQNTRLPAGTKARMSALSF
jgi:putative transposase